MLELLILVWLFLLGLSVVLIFFSGSWAIFVFMISCIVFTVWYNTPEAKKARREARKKEEVEANELKDNFQQIFRDPTNAQALDYVLNVLKELNRQKLESLLDSVVLPLLKLIPLDERVRATVFLCAQKTISRYTTFTRISSGNFYEAALDILQQHPDQLSLKKYALEVGRWHYSLVRPDGKVTIYDEQSIQNDILVRTK
ncbi:MAG: hypothetical protein VKK04_07430 [Synechococcales bacterium]|nr:hypothetical protein [Synechococcales bacterium]